MGFEIISDFVQVASGAHGNVGFFIPRIWVSVSAVTTILCPMFGFNYVTAWVCTHTNN